MATAAFRSSTKRSSVGGSAGNGSTSSASGSSSVHRRARSVSRFSHRFPSELEAAADFVPPTPTKTKGKFVNTARGAAVPEISLDDLVIELFSSSSGGGFSSDRGGRSCEASGSQRRDRSVSSLSSRIGGERKSVVGGRVVPDGSCSRRRRSLSVVRYQASDSESDSHFKNFRSHINAKSSVCKSKQSALVHKPAAADKPRGLRRCSSQRDMLRSHDVCSSFSSALTDDESRDGHYGSDDFEKSCSIYSRNKSEKRKQELLAEIMLEEQRGQELKRIVGELLPEPKETSPVRRPSRARKRSNDRRRTSRQLNEEAEKIIEDFISSVEDNTDISSFDGERSDTSSTFGVTRRSRDNPAHFGEIESQRTPPVSAPVAVEMDGVFLPWLQWDASNDSFLPSKDKTQIAATPKTVLQDALEEMNVAHKQEQSTQSSSSRGSWSPMPTDSLKFSGLSIRSNNQIMSSVPMRRSRVIVDMDDYMRPKSNEEFILERWNQRERIYLGGIFLCRSSFGGMFLL